MTPKLRPEVELPRPRSNGAALVAVASLAMFTAVGASAFVVRVRMEQANWENQRVQVIAPILSSAEKASPDNRDDPADQEDSPRTSIGDSVMIHVKNGVTPETHAVVQIREAVRPSVRYEACDPSNRLDPLCDSTASVVVKRPIVEVELVDVPRGHEVAK